MGLCALLAAVCMAFAVVMFTPSTKAFAATETATAEQFVVLNSASVRTVDEETAGVRYITKISVEFYERVKDQNPEWHTLYAIDQEDETAITLELSGVISINNGTAIEPYGHDEDGDGNYDYYKYQTVMSLYKENATQEELEWAYNLNLSARSYVQFGDTVIYSYADESSDTHRNAAEVAEKVLVDDQLDSKIYDQEEMAEAKEILAQYVNANKKTPAGTLDTLAYLEDFSMSTADSLTALGVEDGEYTITINGISQEITVAGGVANVEQGAFGLDFSANLGDTYVATIVDASSNKCYQNVRYVSSVINDTTEFIAYTKYYAVNGGLADCKITPNAELYYDGATFAPRLYVLGNTVSWTGWGDVHTAVSTNTAGIVADTLDGQGYTLEGTTEGPGIFHVIASNTTIKNLALVIHDLVDWDGATIRYAVARYIGCGSTFENMYINFVPCGNSNVTFAESADWGGSPHGYNIIDTYMYVPQYTIVSGANTNWGYVAGVDWPESTISNYNVVSPTLNMASNGASTEAIAGATHYNTVEELLAVKTKVGDWAINADGTATYQGEDNANVDYDTTQNFVAEAQEASISTDGKTTIAVADVNGLVWSGYVAMATLNTDLVSIENGVITALGTAGVANITVAWQVGGVAYTATVEITIG